MSLLACSTPLKQKKPILPEAPLRSFVCPGEPSNHRVITKLGQKAHYCRAYTSTGRFKRGSRSRKALTELSPNTVRREIRRKRTP